LFIVAVAVAGRKGEYRSALDAASTGELNETLSLNLRFLLSS
jgi:hypothetical protein